VGGRGGIGSGLAGGIAGGAIGAGLANRVGDRPGGRLPGLGDGRPGQLPGDRALGDRRQDLQNRLTGDRLSGDRAQNAKDWGQTRQNWQDQRNQIREDWQNHRDQAREDWQNWFDDNYPFHGGWYWGHAGGYWGAWDHLWDEHPVAAAVGLTSWAATAIGSTFGCGDYSNPYYEESQAVSYAEPIVTQAAQPAAEAGGLPPGVSQEALDKFDQARAAFMQGDYATALKLTDEAVTKMPHDAVLHEFRSLVLFALKRYQESAAAINAVLAVGPGWDAKTLATLYPDMDVYTTQLRALEAARNANPKAADLRFLCGYHYLTCGYSNEALDEFREAAKLQPQDSVSASLVATLSPRDAKPAAEKAEAAPKQVPSDEIVGAWTAAGKRAEKYSMDLRKDGTFTWAFSRGSKKQEVKGVYTVEGNVLAMEPDTGGILLAELTKEGADNLQFQMVGGTKKESPLKFQRGAKG
jgi:tetratricopeptide (TPR) repeat protein